MQNIIKINTNLTFANLKSEVKLIESV